MALALSRRLSIPYEEARAISNLGRLALARGEHDAALVKMQKALAIFRRLGALLDIVAVYRDMTQLFLAQGDFSRAEEMARLRQHQARVLGHSDLNLLALLDLAECEARTGRLEESRADYASALRQVQKEGDEIPSTILHLISEKAIGFLEKDAGLPDGVNQARLLRERLLKGDYQGLLEELPASWNAGGRARCQSPSWRGEG